MIIVIAHIAVSWFVLRNSNQMGFDDCTEFELVTSAIKVDELFYRHGVKVYALKARIPVDQIMMDHGYQSMDEEHDGIAYYSKPERSSINRRNEYIGVIQERNAVVRFLSAYDSTRGGAPLNYNEIEAVVIHNEVRYNVVCRLLCRLLGM